MEAQRIWVSYIEKYYRAMSHHRKTGIEQEDLETTVEERF